MRSVRARTRACVQANGGNLMCKNYWNWNFVTFFGDILLKIIKGTLSFAPQYMNLRSKTFHFKLVNLLINKHQNFTSLESIFEILESQIQRKLSRCNRMASTKCLYRTFTELLLPSSRHWWKWASHWSLESSFLLFLSLCKQTVILFSCNNLDIVWITTGTNKHSHNSVLNTTSKIWQSAPNSCSTKLRNTLSKQGQPSWKMAKLKPKKLPLPAASCLELVDSNLDLTKWSIKIEE